MNELSQIKLTMSSREIAELTGKRHDNVLRDCDVLNENYEKLSLLKIEEGYYTHPNTGNQQHRECLLTRMQTFDLMTGYNTELRIKVNRRWEELEKKERITIDSISRKDLARMLYEAEEAKEKLEEENRRKSLALKEATPKILFADAVTASETSILIGELAKILKQNGIEIGQNRLFEWLRKNDYLCSRGESYNLPTQKAMELGLFEIKKTTISPPDGPIFVSVTTKVTSKGQVYFINKFLKAA